MIFAMRELLDVLFATLWQDAILGGCIAAVLYAFGGRFNATTRHLLLQAALIAMILVPVVTTVPHLTFATVSESGEGAGVAVMTSAAASATDGFGLRRIDVALSDRVISVLTALWLAGASAFLLRIALAMAQLSRVVRRSNRLADRAGARMYVSSTISVPIAFGLLRPAIVIPADIERSSGSELECVLLHELAHVHRGDAWLHTFERLAHAMLFFNPAFTLLLQSIALEREAACDDWAVAQSHDAPTYTETLALLAVRTGVAAEVPVACGAMGFGHAIINRIERLQDFNRNRSLLLSPYALGGFAFMLAGIGLSIQMLAPAVAFSPQAKIAQQTAASAACTRDAAITYPAPSPGALPRGAATVKVSVSPTGAVTAVTIATSSGNATFDRTALKVAKENGYEPALRHCKPAPGIYFFKLTSAGVE